MSYLDRPAPPKGPPWAHNSVGASVHNTLAAVGPVPHEGDYPDFAGQLTAIGERLLDLPSATRVLPGHGEETTIGDAAKRFDGWVTAGPTITDL